MITWDAIMPIKQAKFTKIIQNDTFEVMALISSNPRSQIPEL